MANRIRKTMLTFYVTDEEKEFIKHKMSLMNITNMSAYLKKWRLTGI